MVRVLSLRGTGQSGSRRIVVRYGGVQASILHKIGALNDYSGSLPQPRPQSHQVRRILRRNGCLGGANGVFRRHAYGAGHVNSRPAAHTRPSSGSTLGEVRFCKAARTSPKTSE